MICDGVQKHISFFETYPALAAIMEDSSHPVPAPGAQIRWRTHFFGEEETLADAPNVFHVILLGGYSGNRTCPPSVTPSKCWHETKFLRNIESCTFSSRKHAQPYFPTNIDNRNISENSQRYPSLLTARLETLAGYLNYRGNISDDSK